MKRNKFAYIYLPAFMVGLMWISKLLEYLFELDFKTFGIFPRTTSGLVGIASAPFIHSDFNHLISNTLSFFFLSLAIFYFYAEKALRIILFTWVLTGFTVWLGARFAWHIGASGLVYGFASFLFFSGILSKDRQMIAISLLVIFLYGGMIWGIFPGQVNISWESHLFGFISGFIAAFYFGKKPVQVQFPSDDKATNNHGFEDSINTYQNDYEIFYEYNDNNYEKKV